MLPDPGQFEKVGEEVLADYLSSRSLPDHEGDCWAGSVMQMERLVEGADRLIDEGVAIPPNMIVPQTRFKAMYQRIKDRLQHYLISLESA